jgi:hypothetical protein
MGSCIRVSGTNQILEQQEGDTGSAAAPHELLWIPMGSLGIAVISHGWGDTIRVLEDDAHFVEIAVQPAAEDRICRKTVVASASKLCDPSEEAGLQLGFMIRKLFLPFMRPSNIFPQKEIEKDADLFGRDEDLRDHAAKPGPQRGGK